MKRVSLYSSSRRVQPPAVAVVPAVQKKSIPLRVRLRWAAWPLFAVLLLAISASGWFTPRGIQQKDVEGSIAKAIENLPKTFSAGAAYEKISPSVVFVRGIADDTEDTDGKPPPSATGSGVVIVDDGTILTNLHVVNGAKRIRVTFFDGLEAAATVVGLRAEHDLAVLKPEKI